MDYKVNDVQVETTKPSKFAIHLVKYAEIFVNEKEEEKEDEGDVEL